MNRYYNPVRIVQGSGCIDCLPEILEEMNLVNRRVLFIVWEREVLQHSVFFQLQKSEIAFDIQTVVFKESNPTIDQLFEIYQETEGFYPEVVVAIGGGSIMDVGKSLCCLYGKVVLNVVSLRALIQNKNYCDPAVRWIGIPTTAGTGSEVTCWATIWDPARDAKRSIEDHGNYAYAALVDPQLAEGMPLKLAVSSVLDALAHAVESYWAKGTNCVSRALALQAIRVIMSNLENLLFGQGEVHDYMAQASMLAGLAFSNTKTTACHAISYPFTMHYGIPHGTAVSMLLAPVLQMNAPSVEGMNELFEALGVTDAETLKHRICSMLRSSGQPASLQEWGVQKKDLPHLAELGLTKGRSDNNPVQITEEKVKKILEAIYSMQKNEIEKFEKGERSDEI